MKRILLVFILFISFLVANESKIVKQKNVLTVQNIIKREELIAQAFEKFLLTEFKYPQMVELVSANYLGTNFSNENPMGDKGLFFKVVDSLKLNFAVTKDYDKYVYDLYKRDLYREFTSAVVLYSNDDGSLNTNGSYILVKLQSEEAKNIHSLLVLDKVIQKDCSDPKATLYCSKNDEYIRWYDDSLNWIEYSKKEMNLANVSISSLSFFDTNKDKLNELAIGTIIHVENKGKYIKTAITDELKEVN